MLHDKPLEHRFADRSPGKLERFRGVLQQLLDDFFSRSLQLGQWNHLVDEPDAPHLVRAEALAGEA